jgi:DMSO/TMAO reductase YedYZ molybdopterin-dependent catalytic subunit
MDQMPYRVRGFFGRIPSEPHQLIDRFTPTDGCIVLCHLGVPEIASGDDWEIEFSGLVAKPIKMSVRQLKALPKSEVASVHQCAGSPLAPQKATQRVCNVKWAGVRLEYLLSELGVAPEARFVWSFGADSGEFGGIECGQYIKDLPFSRATSDVLLAYEMNEVALLPEHGFPVRLVVPGFYGTNSVKWLRKIELHVERAQSPFTTRWYNDPDSGGSGTRPVWEVAPQSVIVWPKPGAEVNAGEVIQVWGWTWADGGVSSVELSGDDGQTWLECNLEPATGRTWRKFVCEWKAQAGCRGLISRATSLRGDSQPPTGWRNAFYRVALDVV